MTTMKSNNLFVDVFSNDFIPKILAKVDSKDPIQIDKQAEILLEFVAKDFIKNLAKDVKYFAKIRNTKEITTDDVLHILEENYDIKIPGAKSEIEPSHQFQPDERYLKMLETVENA